MNNVLISVLIPFHGDDPSELLRVLDMQAGQYGLAIEFVLGDDASYGGTPALLRSRIFKSKQAVTLIVAPQNLGRARMRNRLAQAASGRHLLFLDADMLPDSPLFLSRYCELVARTDPMIVFGGISLAQTPSSRATALHRSLSLATECLTADERRKNPVVHVFTSNLLVRADIFRQCEFDTGFAGWGWEDVEWALRAGAKFPVLHTDNPATHLGLYEDAALLGRYETSVENFRRLICLHPATSSAMRLGRLSQILAGWPRLVLLQATLRRLILAKGLPMALRLACLRLWRALLYSEAFRYSKPAGLPSSPIVKRS
jgi:glycosyltransferase involved in cell wall biosynthesis